MDDIIDIGVAETFLVRLTAFHTAQSQIKEFASLDPRLSYSTV